jgi:tRNA(Ile)-lysidine synthase
MIRYIDKSLKELGVMISKNTRDEVLRQNEITISNKISISIVNSSVWIAPKVDNTMDKKFKEKCRLLKIPKNIRNYLNSLNENEFKDLLNKVEKI